jgi:hypothetical protein
MEVITPITIPVLNNPIIGKKRKGISPERMQINEAFELFKNMIKHCLILFSSTRLSFKRSFVTKADASRSTSGILIKIMWLIKTDRIKMIETIIKIFKNFVLNHFHSSK